jgi:hypothetical protein
MSAMKKLIAAAGIAAGLGLGGYAIGSVLPVGASTPSETTPSTAPSTPDGARGTAGTILQSALSKLVADGTLTQAQADAVTAAVRAEAAQHPLFRHPVLRAYVIDEAFDVAAKTIGVSADDLRAAVRGGQSIADVASQHGVERQTVIDALVNAGSARLDAAVAAGHLKQETADMIKSHLPDAAARFVDFKRGA